MQPIEIMKVLEIMFVGALLAVVIYKGVAWVGATGDNAAKEAIARGDFVVDGAIYADRAIYSGSCTEAINKNFEEITDLTLEVSRLRDSLSDRFKIGVCADFVEASAFGGCGCRLMTAGTEAKKIIKAMLDDKYRRLIELTKCKGE